MCSIKILADLDDMYAKFYMKFYVKTTLDGHDLLKFQGIKVTQEEEPKASLNMDFF